MPTDRRCGQHGNFRSLLSAIDGKTLPRPSVDMLEARGKTRYAKMRSGMRGSGATKLEDRGSASEAGMLNRRGHGLSKAELRASGELAVAERSKPTVEL